MSEVELKPCPFCGGTTLDDDGENVICSDCLAIGPDADYLEGGISSAAAWNRRAGEAVPAHENRGGGHAPWGPSR